MLILSQYVIWAENWVEHLEWDNIFFMSLTKSAVSKDEIASEFKNTSVTTNNREFKKESSRWEQPAATVNMVEEASE